MVIVITGILSAMVAVFLKTPVDQYINVARRAALTDIADTALRRIGRDLRLAVPNSIRVPVATNASYIEFLPTKTGGRYRANATGGGGSCATVVGNTEGDTLSFSSADTCFETIGQNIDVVAGDFIVVGSTQVDGNPPYQDPTDATCTVPTIRRLVSAVVTGASVPQKVVLTSLCALPSVAKLASQRFDVVSASEQAVTYACNNVATDAHGDGQGELRRYWAYGFNAALTDPTTLITGSSALLATKVSGCSINYTNVNQRNGLVAIHLTLTSGNESISLYSETHVNNLP